MKLIDAIFCDDIRQEMNNKFSLMGIYNDKIIFSNKNDIKFPFALKLSLLLRFKLDKNDSFPDHFEFSYFMNKKNILNIKGLIMPSPDKNILLALTNQILPLEIGQLHFSIQFYKNSEVVFSPKSSSSGLQIL